MTSQASTLKTELHVHLYGCLDASSVWTLGKDRFRAISERLTWYEAEYEKVLGRRPDSKAYWTEDNGFERLLDDFVMTEPEDFPRFQARFNLLIALFPMVPGDTTVLDRVLRVNRAQGLRHVEQRILIPPAMDDQSMIAILRDFGASCLEIERESGGEFTPRLVVSFGRQNQLFHHRFERFTSLLLENPDLVTAYVGIDFCGFEEDDPPAGKKAVFDQILNFNHSRPNESLAILHHVGESFASISLASAARRVWQAHALGAHRLGHGLALGLDPDLFLDKDVTESVSERLEHLEFLLAERDRLTAADHLIDVVSIRQEINELKATNESVVKVRFDQQMADDCRTFQEALLSDLARSGAIIECCPTSNLRIGGLRFPRHHPLPRFLDAGLRVCVSSDDPGIFGTTLADEETLCSLDMGLADQMDRLEQTAWECRSELIAGRGSTHQ